MHNVAMLLQDSQFHENGYGIQRFTYCMEHSPSLEANRFLASQGIPCILWNIRFIAAFISAH
jgi:hypothetical protein